jgi:two-component system sensor kinase FixL
LTEATGLRKDGTEFPLELAISVVEENGQKEFLAIIRDLSERYVADKQLKLAAQGLATRRKVLPSPTRIIISNR